MQISILSRDALDLQGDGASQPVALTSQGVALGSTICSDGDQLPEITKRMGIGRHYFNKLYHAFINTDIPESLRLDMFQASVIGGSSYGSAAWVLSPAKMEVAIETTALVQRIVAVAGKLITEWRR